MSKFMQCFNCFRASTLMYTEAIMALLTWQSSFTPTMSSLYTTFHWLDPSVNLCICVYHITLLSSLPAKQSEGD